MNAMQRAESPLNSLKWMTREDLVLSVRLGFEEIRRMQKQVHDLEVKNANLAEELDSREYWIRLVEDQVKKLRALDAVK